MMKRIFGKAVFGAATLSVVIAAGSASAEMKFKRDSAAVAKAFAAAGKRATDPSVSGYVTDEGPVTQASASLKVPTLTCGADERRVYMGLEGQRVAADIILRCYEGEPTYLLEAYVSGQGPALSEDVEPGDIVDLSITQSTMETTATVAIGGDTKVSTLGMPDPESSMIFGTLDVADTLPPEFSKAEFTKSKFNGAKLSTKTTTKVNRKDENTKISTGKLKKGAFSQKFKLLEE